MSRRNIVIFFLFLAVCQSGCASKISHWRQDARIVLDAARLNGADKALPIEYENAVETYKRGDISLENNENESAEGYYQFAWLKGKSLLINYDEAKKRRAAEVLRKYQEEKLENDRQRIVQEEQKRLIQEKTEAGGNKNKIEKGKTIKDKPLYHTVKRGETLPQIAAQVDVYGDYRLWPLLYRANRDQISDPRHIWPGQVLRIPRNSTREEMSEARRYSSEKPI